MKNIITCSETNPNPLNGTSFAESYITKRDVAKYCRVSVRTIDEWMKSGRLPYRKIGRTVRFLIKEIEAFHKEQFGVNLPVSFGGAR